jgi:guanylate kinase
MKFPEYINNFIKDYSDINRKSERIFGIDSKLKEQKEDAKNKKRILLLVTGLSGAGKDTIVRGLLEKDRRFGRIKTCTTRSRRPGETEENDTYIRLTKEEFQKAQKEGDVFESVEYAGNYYCSLSSVFKKAFKDHEIPLLQVDPKGSSFYIDSWRKNEEIFEDINLIFVFIVPPTLDTLKERLFERSGDMSFVEKRLEQTKLDLPFLSEAEYIVINQTGAQEKVVEELLELFPA